METLTGNSYWWSNIEISEYEIDPIIKCNFLSQRFLEKEPFESFFQVYLCDNLFIVIDSRSNIENAEFTRKSKEFFSI